MERMTEKEKMFAEKNHNLVYAFFRSYQYSIEEHYNTAIWGYLKSVQAYHRDEELRRKYDFPFIAWQYMRSEMGNYFRKENAKKRKPEQKIFSLDIGCTAAGNSLEDEWIEAELLEIVLENLSEQQRKIANMKVDGYSNREVFVLLEIPSSTYYKQLGRIRLVVENILKD